MSVRSIYIVYFALAIALGIIIGSLLDFDNTPGIAFSQNKQKAKIKRLIDYIQYDYVDEVDTDSLLDKTINQLLLNLDPHSVYIPENEVDAIHETINGNFMGIGVEFRMVRDTVTVIRVIPGGPSEKAGILAGDRILIANNDTLYGKKYYNEDITRFLKSETPTPIRLSIFRKKTNENLKINFNRGNVNISSTEVYYMINPILGYIKIDIFGRNTYKDFYKALIALKSQGMKSLVVDLRNNTGGLLDVANDVIDELLPDATLMVYTKSKSGRITKSFATNKGDFETGNVYVLINEESASASEILAGAVQDNDRGTIVGRRSFGKGLVQQEMDLGDGSMVRLTTARYYTPTGRSIQKPYDHNGNFDYFHDAITRTNSGELFYADSIPVVDSLKYTTPKGKVVYGGGGIIPDVFVALDTTMYFSVYEMTHINEFVFDYVDERRGKLEQKAFDDFKDEFDINEFYGLYKQKHQPLEENSDKLKWYLKAVLAREIYGETAFYTLYQKRDKMITKVIELEGTK